MREVESIPTPRLRLGQTPRAVINRMPPISPTSVLELTKDSLERLKFDLRRNSHPNPSICATNANAVMRFTL